MEENKNKISLCIGSHGSYNACNERAYGSWIEVTKYDKYEDILEELKRLGYELDGIDEELWVFDVDFETEIDYANNGGVLSKLLGETSPREAFNIVKRLNLVEESNLELLFAINELEEGHISADVNFDDYWLNKSIKDDYDYGLDLFEGIFNTNSNNNWVYDYIDFDRMGSDSVYDSNAIISTYGLIQRV